MNCTIAEIRVVGKKARDLQSALTERDDKIQKAFKLYDDDGGVDVNVVNIDPINDRGQHLSLKFELDGKYPALSLVCEDNGESVDITFDQVAELHKVFGAILGKK